eukprot:TRINITY_DN35896_c0_g1_i1.p1 TRINITY_DN35896_c0_g1~~TRINITY_DN35896_c0_g1_i1.p1  ORF type:complete len:443 (+),score=94.92 TRINITY_DN35896_c0_g1_i1:91-1419(+)
MSSDLAFVLLTNADSEVGLKAVGSAPNAAQRIHQAGAILRQQPSVSRPPGLEDKSTGAAALSVASAVAVAAWLAPRISRRSRRDSMAQRSRVVCLASDQSTESAIQESLKKFQEDLKALSPAQVPFSPGGSGDVVRQLLLPSSVAGLAGAVSLIPLAAAVRALMSESTQMILKDDVTQYTQNAFTVVGLLFTLLLAETLSMMVSRQQNLFNAIFAEISEAQALIEQITLLCSGRYAGSSSVEEVAGSQMSFLLDDLESYLEKDFGNLGETPLLPSPESQGSTADLLERLLFATSVGVPSSICSSVMALRNARAQRLAAAQRRFPPGHYTILYFFGFLVLLMFIILSAGTASFEQAGQAAYIGHIWWLHAPLFGLLVGTIALSVLLIQALSDPGRKISESIFGPQLVAQEAIRGLTQEFKSRQEARVERRQQREILGADPAGV